MAHQFDLFVIGAGSGGVRASRIAARTGARVAICEEYKVGGTCVLRGCIPKKILWYASHHHHAIQDSRNFGWSSKEDSFDWPTLMHNKEKELERLNGVYKNLLSGSGVTTIEGHAHFVDQHTVQVGEEKYTAKHILIATGSSPHLPEDVPGIEHVITSNEALELPVLPKRVAIVGGGYIACEFAGIFHGCGSKVTQIYRGDHFLRGFDEDCRKAVTDEMRADGIDVRLNTNVTKIEKQGEGEFVCHLDKGEPLSVDTILYATGRLPNIHKLNLEAAGVKTNSKGAIIVDEYSKTNVDNIYAVGDVTDRMNLTPVALGEGHAFADTVFGGKPRKFSHKNVASAVFSQPPLSSVGLTEEEAKKKYNGAIDVYVSRFTPLKHTISKRATKSFMKLIVARETERVIGCHMVGEDAPEIIQGIAIAVVMKAKKEDFDRTVGIHPTAAEEFVTMRTKRE